MLINKHQAASLAGVINRHRPLNSDVEINESDVGELYVSVSLFNGPWYHIDFSGRDTEIDRERFDRLMPPGRRR